MLVILHENVKLMMEFTVSTHQIKIINETYKASRKRSGSHGLVYTLTFSTFLQLQPGAARASRPEQN